MPDSKTARAQAECLTRGITRTTKKYLGFSNLNSLPPEMEKNRNFHGQATSVLDLYLHSKTHRIVTSQNNTKMLPKFLAAPPPPLLSGHLSCGSGPGQPSRQASASTRAAQRNRSGGRHVRRPPSASSLREAPVRSGDGRVWARNLGVRGSPASSPLPQSRAAGQPRGPDPLPSAARPSPTPWHRKSPDTAAD